MEIKSNYSIQEVKSPEDAKAFLHLPLKIYAKDPNWIRPLDKDIEEVFDKEKNKFFRHGECTRWLLYNNDELIGRVATFINKKYKTEQPTGGIGFFECINDKDVAHFIFDHCKQWLQERGMEAMDGPINFGERDKWWGLVREGFFEPLYGMNYNPPYYVDLFESYGFQVYFNQECFGMDVAENFHEKFYIRHKEHKKNPNLKAIQIRKNNLDKFAKDFTYIYNKAWAAHGEGKTLAETQAKLLFKSMKPVIDEKLTWFVYHNEEPIAFWVNLPDLNQYFKHLNGKFGLLQKLKFLWLQKFGKCTRFVGLVFGVIPEWQGKGIDNYMILEGAAIIVPQSGYQKYEMQWIGDFNPKMVNIARSLGASVTRRLSTYRYIFDRSKEFKRHKIL